MNCASLSNIDFVRKARVHSFEIISKNVFAKNGNKANAKTQVPKLAGIYLLKVNNNNTRTKCEICSKLTIKIPERRHGFL